MLPEEWQKLKMHVSVGSLWLFAGFHKQQPIFEETFVMFCLNLQLLHFCFLSVCFDLNIWYKKVETLAAFKTFWSLYHANVQFGFESPCNCLGN
jgi:hypothetical protein